MKVKPLKIGLDAPIYTMLIGMLIIQIAKPLQKNYIMSFGTWLIIISTVMAFVIALTLHRVNDNNLFPVIVLSMLVIASVVVSFVFTYQSIVYALSFMEIPLLMVSYSKNQKSNVCQAIYSCFVILSVYYHCLSFSPLANIYYTDYGEINERFLTLGYQNPNETAMYLVVCIFVLAIMFKDVNSIFAKSLIIVDVLLLTRLIVLTYSRTGITSLALFFAFSFFFRKRKIPNYFMKLCMLVPVGFIVLTFVLNTRSLDWFFLGEAIDTGRLEMYQDVFDNLSVLSFFFGNFNIGFRNLHNALLCIFATIGIVGVLVFYVFIYQKIKSVRNEVIPQSSSQIALLGLLCIFIYTATEAAFLTAGGAFAVAVSSLYFLSVFDHRQFLSKENIS